MAGVGRFRGPSRLLAVHFSLEVCAGSRIEKMGRGELGTRGEWRARRERDCRLLDCLQSISLSKFVQDHASKKWDEEDWGPEESGAREEKGTADSFVGSEDTHSCQLIKFY